jgi:hypothetical protein
MQYGWDRNLTGSTSDSLAVQSLAEVLQWGQFWGTVRPLFWSPGDPGSATQQGPYCGMRSSPCTVTGQGGTACSGLHSAFTGPVRGSAEYMWGVSLLPRCGRYPQGLIGDLLTKVSL